MIKHLFLLKDTKAEIYHGPYSSLNAQVYLRDLSTLKDSDTQFSKHPSDFAVYSCGTLNDSTGVVEPTPPVHMINLDDLFRGV